MSPVRRSRWFRCLTLASLASLLLATGPCLTTAEQSLINGFFDALTPLVVDQARQQLGLPALTPAGTSGA